MKSIILSLAGKLLFFPLIALSIIVLYRGHNFPGGGFIGGLLASAPFALIMLADGVEAARIKLRIEPSQFIAAGLGIAGASALVSLLWGLPWMTGIWLPGFTLPILGAVHLGTPVLFDIGVYLAVIGFTLGVLFELEDLE